MSTTCAHGISPWDRPRSPALSSIGRLNTAEAARPISPFTLHHRRFSARSSTRSPRTHRPTPQTVASALMLTTTTCFSDPTTSGTTAIIEPGHHTRPPAGCGKTSSSRPGSAMAEEVKHRRKNCGNRFEIEVLMERELREFERQNRSMSPPPQWYRDFFELGQWSG